MSQQQAMIVIYTNEHSTSAAPQHGTAQCTTRDCTLHIHLASHISVQSPPTCACSSRRDFWCPLESHDTDNGGCCQAAEEEAERRQQAEQERQAGLVRQERQRLLREAAYLKDYLPKGVLQDLEDLRIINEAAAHQPTHSLAGGVPYLQAASQPLHVTGPVHGVQSNASDGMSEKLHYANYVPGETPLLQDTYQLSIRQ